MSDWDKCKLEDIVVFQRGHDLTETSFIKGEYPVAGSNGIINFHNEYTTLGPGLTLGRSGNSIGVTHYYKTNFWAHNTTLYSKEFKNSYPKYVYYLLKTIDFKSFNTGSAVPSLNRNHIKLIDILMPSLLEQKIISSILSSLDDKIDLLNSQNQTLEKLAETLFRQWFMEEAKEEWEEVKLVNFIQPRKGKNITKSEAIEGQFPVVAGGLEPSCFHIQSNTKAPVITISASGANAGFVRLYNYPVWSSDSSFIDETVTSFVYTFYVFLKINQGLLFDKQEGSAQPHIYPSHIEELAILNYPVILIEKFENFIKPYFQKIKQNQTQILTLEKLRNTLLPKLISGEVRVKQ